MLDRVFKKTMPVSEYKFDINKNNVAYDISLSLKSLICDAKILNREIVILCIGTDRSTGDALGPLTGTKLKSINFHPHIYGTLDDPVHATNLKDKLAQIQAAVNNPFIIAIDACLGKLENVGYVSLGSGPLKPGAAVNKELPSVGDCYITGIVNVGGFMEHLVLQSTRLNLVFKMSDTIAHSLSFALNKLYI